MSSLTPRADDSKLTVGSLFSGIGGFDLGLERAGMRVEWQVEIDPYASAVLAKHWPHVTRYGDIRTIDWSTVAPVDVLCGGFPCQDLSFAGKRAGIDGERSGLWSEYVRAIRALRPRYVLVENVPGLLTNAYMGRVLGDLAESGYDAEWDCLPAGIFGAHFRRDRVFIIAGCPLPCGLRFQRVRTDQGRTWSEQQFTRLVEYELSVCVPAGKMQRVSDGLPHRVDRLRGLGNAVVPAIVEAIGKMILEVHRGQYDPKS
jgi:DNA (cytosine-5)-methyltransferase 1